MRIWRDLTLHRFHRAIRREAVARLGRKLTPEERRFITSRHGFMALEMIMDTVRTSTPDELESYLNSE